MGIRLPWWVWAFWNWTLVLVAAIVLTTVAGAHRWNVPHDPRWRPDQCEALRYDHVVIEFQNTWSNLGYLAAGLLILYRRPGVLGVMVGIDLALLALFSGCYHASLQPVPQSFDVGWIYAVLLSMYAYAADALAVRYHGRHLRRSATIPLAIVPTAFGLAVSILKAKHAWHVDSTTFTGWLLGILAVVVAFVLLNFGARQRILFACCIGVPALLCIFFRLGDGRGHPLCNPTAPLQAHALWHVLGAVALAMTYDLLAEAGPVREAILLPACSGRRQIV